jgi:hypothetical protein
MAQVMPVFSSWFRQPCFCYCFAMHLCRSFVCKDTSILTDSCPSTSTRVHGNLKIAKHQQSQLLLLFRHPLCHNLAIDLSCTCVAPPLQAGPTGAIGCDLVATLRSHATCCVVVCQARDLGCAKLTTLPLHTDSTTCRMLTEQSQVQVMEVRVQSGLLASHVDQ